MTETIDCTLQPDGSYLTRFFDIRGPYHANPKRAVARARRTGVRGAAR